MINEDMDKKLRTIFHSECEKIREKVLKVLSDAQTHEAIDLAVLTGLVVAMIKNSSNRQGAYECVVKALELRHE